MRTQRTLGPGRHGAVGTKEYHTWKAMVQKCTNPTHADYAEFGGRGIRVCGRWRAADGFANFLADLGPQPYRGAGLHLIDPAGHFEPGNVDWASTRSRHVLTHRGRTQSVTAWAHELGVKPATLRARIRKGWPVEDVLEVMVGYRAAPRIDFSHMSGAELWDLLGTHLRDGAGLLDEAFSRDEA